MKLDLTTASMIASVYDKVNPMNKKRMDSLKLPQLINLTMKVAAIKGKMKKEDAVERAKELADLKAKHKREIEQEKKTRLPQLNKLTNLLQETYTTKENVAKNEKRLNFMMLKLQLERCL